jgi:hypothetical protein
LIKSASVIIDRRGNPPSVGLYRGNVPQAPVVGTKYNVCSVSEGDIAKKVVYRGTQGGAHVFEVDRNDQSSKIILT